MTEHAQGQHYGLVMPFICCVSNGGPYEDKSFVAGCTMERIAAILEYKQPDEHQVYVAPGLVKQLDLVAMHNGYTVTFEPWEDFPDEWELAMFKRNSRDDQTLPPKNVLTEED